MRKRIRKPAESTVRLAIPRRRRGCRRAARTDSDHGHAATPIRETSVIRRFWAILAERAAGERSAGARCTSTGRRPNVCATRSAVFVPHVTGQVADGIDHRHASKIAICARLHKRLRCHCGACDGGTERDERTAVRPGRQRPRPTRYRSGLTRPVRVVRQAARSHMSERQPAVQTVQRHRASCAPEALRGHA